MADPQDFTDDELLTVYKNPKSDLSKLTPGELQRLDRLTMPAVDRATMRAQGDAAAAREQQRLQTTPTFTMGNAAHDLTQAGRGLFGVLKTLGTAAVTNPLGLNQPDIRYDPAAHANDPSLRDQASSAFGTLRTLPGRAWSALTTDPRETALEAGITPDVAAQGIGAATGIGLTAAVAKKSPVLSPSGIRAGLTRFAEDVPIVKGVKPALDAYKAAAQSDADAIGQFRGTLRTNSATPRQLSYGPELVSPGGTPPPAAPLPAAAAAAPVQPGGPDLFERMRTEGVRFDTPGSGAGQVGPVPPPKPNVLLPANDLRQILEEVRQTPEPGPTAVEAPPAPTMTPGGRPSLTAQQYAEIEQGSPGAGAYTGTPESAYEPAPAPERTGPPPRLVKGEAPSLQDALITALEDIRQEGGEAGTTPPDVTLTEAGKPSVTPERASEIGETAPPAGTTRQVQPEVPPTLPKPGNPIPAGDLTAMLEELRQTNEPVTTASGAPPQELTPGGRPSQTQADYDALVEAAQRRQALEKAVGAQTASSAAPAETPAPGVTATEGVKPPPTPVVDEAEAAGVPEETDAGSAAGTTRTPSPAELTPDEVRRKEIGARDFAAEQRRETDVTETPDEVRARTQARTTGKTSQVSVLPTGAVNRITSTLKDMIAGGASDAELLDYLNKAPSDKSKQQIGLLLNALLHGTGRNIVGLGGAAVTGAMLRQALVGQLQGDQKEQD